MEKRAGLESLSMEPVKDPSTFETVAIPLSLPVISSSAPAADEGRFVPGTLLGGRYRIIALLGRGGMGEVYRATDLTLGQSVALKFLPEEASRDQRLLERFHGEVRMARQVSHPNVCRVYDIGEVEGMPFLSMEYVDGEDLASLLLRIGRLPADKALDTARKICAGLAAAHDRGIIHRDLKPANIMMNKRGEVVIMDFGLAALASQLSGPEARNGTPAYMSPEQLKGAEVTPRSDIYALGLVLYELFTGKRPYDGTTLKKLLEQQELAHLTSMTSIATDIDPAVEKAIRRCLDPNPLRRPGTALAVAAALPGGDPLAAALAAGETPSPELVAAAGETEGLPRKYAVPLLLVTAACLFLVPVIRQTAYATLNAPLVYPPDVLAQKARDIASSFGFIRKPVDSKQSLNTRNDLVAYLRGLPEPRQWTEWLAAESPVAAEYRESLAPLMAGPFGDVTMDNPAPVQPGMAHVTLDGSGRLRGFSAIPYEDGAEIKEPVSADAVFRAAGLEMTKFTEVAPVWHPRVPVDMFWAWKGAHPAIPNTALTMEIGWWKGRVTLVKVGFPFELAAAASKPPASFGAQLIERGPVLLLAIGLTFTILLARRNWRVGRADRKGALRLAGARFAVAAIATLGTMHFAPDFNTWFLLFENIGDWLLSAGLLWLIYLALEPALRARWPHSIVTWNRLLGGRWRDAQVGAHILIGAAVGTLMWVSAEVIEFRFGPRNVLESEGAVSLVTGTRQWLGANAGTLGGVLIGGPLLFLTIFGFRRLVRKDALAAIGTALLLLVSNNGVTQSPQWQIAVPVYFVLVAVLMFVLLKLGLVAAMAAMFFLNDSNAIYTGLDWTAWYAPYGLATLALLLGIAGFAFWRSVGGDLLGKEEDAA